MVNVMCCINVFDLFQRAMLNVLIAELTWRYTKMITIHIFGQNQSILDVQKPCMVNPSSYEALLEWINLKKLVLIKSENGWFLNVMVSLTFLLLK